MDTYQQLAALLDLWEELGLGLRMMPATDDGGEHPGGAVVRLRGQEMLFLDAEASVADRLAVVARALSRRKELENRFLPPELREIIEQHRADETGEA